MQRIIVAALLLALGAVPALAQKSSEIAATAAPATSAAATPAAISAAPPRPAPAAPTPNRTRNTGGDDGPADVLNGFVMKEVAQCRALPPYERRQCCERLLHPNACVE